MFDYIEKFNKLPKEVRDKLSGRPVMDAIEALEKKYNKSLASTILRVAIGEIPYNTLEVSLISDFNIALSDADAIAKDLREQVFSQVADQLNIAGPPPTAPSPPANIAQVIASPASPVLKPENKAPFYFHAEDEEELTGHKAKAGELVAYKSEKPKYEAITDALISDLKINFSNADNEARLRTIIKTYCTGIRNRLNTKLSLTKPAEEGGMGLSELVSAKILDTLDEYLSGAKPLLRSGSADFSAKLAGIGLAGERDIAYDLRGEIAKKQEDLNSVSVLDTAHEIGLPSKTQRIVSGQSIPAGDAIAAPEADIVVRKIIPQYGREASGLGKKVSMDDVKYVPRADGDQGRSFIEGPIDELRQMDLTVFRRISRDPKDSARKIIEKIELLEDEDFAKRTEGIKAWRMSPINRIYLEIGQDSIAGSKSVAQVIAEKQQQGADTLSQEEFDAVMDLNKQLRF